MTEALKQAPPDEQLAWDFSDEKLAETGYSAPEYASTRVRRNRRLEKDMIQITEKLLRGEE